MTGLKVAGIDPGVSGAIALLHGEAFQGVWDMPLKRDRDGKHAPSALGLAELLREHQPHLVVIEQVNAMPSAPGKNGQRRTMGTQSMFNFGRGLGVIDATTQILKLPTVYVSAATWKRQCGLIGSPKDQARVLAQGLFPDALLRRKKDIGRADALLIARFGHTT